ncbi:MAG TPA: DnaJ C-terminal domain-containing protein [Chloroflexia bacterium]|nr:DnaJ C-terminal domain-containing protein [Chloroflexia bacterium]
MAQKDYYKTLEVPRTATEQEIKSSYRRLARKYHPDMNQGNEQAAEHFKEVNEAYEVLGDAEKRRKYDQFGVDWEKYDRAGFSSSGTTGSTSYSYNFNQNGGFGDIFDSIFGGTPNNNTRTRTRTGPGTQTRNDFGFGRSASSGMPRPQRGEDQEQSIEVTLEEAFQGATRQLQIVTNDPCSYCNGTGLRSGQRCAVCNGHGVTPRQKRLEVRIPAGVDDGTKVKVAGEGGPGISGGPRGDLFLKVHVLPHPAFVRKGADLHTTATIPLYTALLGGEIIVSSPRGNKFALNVPSETQNGKVFRLTGQGMPVLSAPNTRGDMYVKVEVSLPSNLSDEEKQLFQQLKNLRSF